MLQVKFLMRRFFSFFLLAFIFILANEACNIPRSFLREGKRKKRSSCVRKQESLEQPSVRN